MAAPHYFERPAPAGTGWACLWSQDVPAGAARYVQAVVPDGCVDLIWWARDASVMVAGPDTGPSPAALEPGDRLVAVRFRPGTAAPALGVPADAVRDGRLQLRELWGPRADALGARVAAAPDPMAALAALVARETGGAPPPDPLAQPLIGLLAERPVRRAAADLGVSERQLRRRAAAAFGYGPKTVQRVLRFQRALALARAGTPLAEVAATAGYTDQAHLAHDVRDLGGAPIRALL